MNALINKFAKLGIFKGDLDYHFIRISMVITYAAFGYQKWLDYEIRGLIPLISHGPLIFWMIPVLGVRGTGIFLGTSEWCFGLLLFLGFWNKKLGVLGALGSCASFISTLSIIPFLPDAWAAPAGGFPAFTLPLGFLFKDLVLLAASFYLLRQDVVRVSSQRPPAKPEDNQIA